MFKYLIVLSNDGIGDVVVVKLDRPIHEVSQCDSDGVIYLMYNGVRLEYYDHSVFTQDEINKLFE